MTKFTDTFGQHSPALYRIGGDAVLRAAERAANLGVDTIKLAATYGRDGWRVLDKLGAVRFAKFSARAAKIG